MKFGLTILVISSFIALAGFGFVVMSHESGHAFCFAATATGGQPPCPINDPLGFANFHINVFKNFSNVAFAESLTLAALSTVMLTLLVSATTLPEFATHLFKKPSFLLIASQGYTPKKIAARKTLYWLSLHETSPCLI